MGEARFDLAMTSLTYHHIDERPAYFRRLQADLAPGGRVVHLDDRHDVPPPFRWLQGKGHWTVPDDMKTEMQEAGYRVEAEHEFLPMQSFMVFTPRAAAQLSGTQDPRRTLRAIGRRRDRGVHRARLSPHADVRHREGVGGREGDALWIRGEQGRVVRALPLQRRPSRTAHATGRVATRDTAGRAERPRVRRWCGTSNRALQRGSFGPWPTCESPPASSSKPARPGRCTSSGIGHPKTSTRPWHAMKSWRSW